MRYALVAIVCIAIAIAKVSAAFASQEGAVPVAEFSIGWDGGEDGPITARGVRRPDGSLQRFTVTAFGRALEMPDAVMAELAKLRFNGVLLSAEPGYPDLGGRTAYLQFVVGFTSGTASSVVVAVNERGDVRLFQRGRP